MTLVTNQAISWSKLYASGATTAFDLFLARSNQKKLWSEVLAQEIIAKWQHVTTPLSILDIGAGEGTLAHDLAMTILNFSGCSINFLAIDPSSDMLNRYITRFQSLAASGRCNVRCVVQEFPGPDGSTSILNGKRFQVILVSHVLFWVQDPAVFIREAAAILAKDGAIASISLSSRTDPATYAWRKSIIDAAYAQSNLLEDASHIERLLLKVGLTVKRFQLITESVFSQDELFESTPRIDEKDNVSQPRFTQLGEILGEFLARRPWIDIEHDARTAIANIIYQRAEPNGEITIKSSEELLWATPAQIHESPSPK